MASSLDHCGAATNYQDLQSMLREQQTKLNELESCSLYLTQMWTALKTPEQDSQDKGAEALEKIQLISTNLKEIAKKIDSLLSANIYSTAPVLRVYGGCSE